MPLKYDIIAFIDDNLILVCLDNKSGLYNKNGEEILPIEYDAIRSFEKGDKYTLAIKDNKEYVIDRNGTVVKELEKNNYRAIFLDRYLVSSDTGYVKFSSNLVINATALAEINNEDGAKYSTDMHVRTQMKDGYLLVSNLKNTICCDNNYNEIKLPDVQYDDMGVISNGLMSISTNKQQDNVTISCEKIYDLKNGKYIDGYFKNILKISDNLTYAVGLPENNKTTIYCFDSNGNEINKFIVEGQIKTKVGNKMVGVKIGGAYYLYNEKGEKYSEDKYKTIELFKNGMIAYVDAADEIKFITDDGKELIDCIGFNAEVNSGIQIRGYNGKEAKELSMEDEGIFFYQENNGTYEVYGFYK